MSYAPSGYDECNPLTAARDDVEYVARHGGTVDAAWLVDRYRITAEEAAQVLAERSAP